jgi:DNA repair protein RecN (Recombination protein N)
MSTVDDAVAVDSGLVPLKAMLNEAYLQLEEAALQLRDYSSRVEADPRRLQQVDDRLDLLQRLKRKYAPTVEEIIELRENLLAELSELESRSSSREELDQQLAEQWTRLEQIGTELGRQRKKAALQLEQQLMEEIRQMAMPHALVKVAFEVVPEPRSSGMDKVEFLFSPNPGEQARPLARVASGGELSRLMLAFKQILPEGEAPTLVFDEVDTGVGGAVADLVGRKLKNLSRNQQVFCVTHLPQVAAWAAQHLLVQKQVEDGRTVTTVRIVEQIEQNNEIARMLAGDQITDAARGHARELIERAKNP